MSDRNKEPYSLPDFNDTGIAFAHKTDLELKKAALLFNLMNKPFITKIGTNLTLAFMKIKFPLTKTIIKKTIFEQFCGGESLMDCQEAIDKLNENGAQTILDYGAESKSSPEELDHVMAETVRALELAASNNSVPVISTKVTGLVDNDILIKLDAGENLNEQEQEEFDALDDRLDEIFNKAADLGVGVFVDAEESWMQEAIDSLVAKYMAKYNKEKAIVYNTYQLYRHDKLAQLKADHQQAVEGGGSHHDDATDACYSPHGNGAHSIVSSFVQGRDHETTNAELFFLMGAPIAAKKEAILGDGGLVA